MASPRTLAARASIGCVSFVLLVSLFAFASPVHAEEVPSFEPAAVTQTLAGDGAYSPLLYGPSPSGRGFAQVSAGYNTVTEQESLDVVAHVRVFDRFSVIARVENITGEEPRPGIGGSVHLLDEVRHGIEATGFLLYKAEGFSEPEGELEALASFGRTFGAVRAVANVAYGQDPEGNERDGELALGAQLHPIEPLFVGVVARYRDALGSRGELGVIRDVFAGASATYVLDRFGVSALAGLSEIETSATDSFEAGAAASLTVGAAF
jgi:hypothetical protein